MIVNRISCATGDSCLPILGHRNWIDADDIHVRFDIRHRGTSILLKFIVEEPEVRAVNTALNSPVWEDSCVEFFLALEHDLNYYNFEFNAIGTLHAAYGPDRHQREIIPDEFSTLIGTSPTLGKGRPLSINGPAKWELDIVIPVKALWKHNETDLAGKEARANLYKCGDQLAKPHYLSWMPVETPQTDFHRPEYFGALIFGA